MISLHVSELTLASWCRPSLSLFGVVVACRCCLFLAHKGSVIIADKVRGLIRQYSITRPEMLVHNGEAYNRPHEPRC